MLWNLGKNGRLKNSGFHFWWKGFSFYLWEGSDFKDGSVFTKESEKQLACQMIDIPHFVCV